MLFLQHYEVGVAICCALLSYYVAFACFSLFSSFTVVILHGNMIPKKKHCAGGRLASHISQQHQSDAAEFGLRMAVAISHCTYGSPGSPARW